MRIDESNPRIIVTQVGPVLLDEPYAAMMFSGRAVRLIGSPFYPQNDKGEYDFTERWQVVQPLDGGASEVVPFAALSLPREPKDVC